MLVFTRKAGETLQIGDNITIIILEVKGNRVRIGIDGPGDLQILRGEVDGWAAVSKLGGRDIWLEQMRRAANC